MKYSNLSVLFLLFIIISCSAGTTNNNSVLDEYVKYPDPTYSYKMISNEKLDGYSLVLINMNSLTWLTEDIVDRTLWQHQLVTIVPDDLTHKNALMWIGGGSNNSGKKEKGSQMLVDIALATQSIVSEVRMIPNQGLRFSDESDPRYQERGRKEDEMIAYAWDKFLSTEDPNWLPRLPMTKAVVRAMDTVQTEFPDIKGFVVAGKSKRGWTAWTTAAVDPRVVAVAPLVIDIPNVVKSMQHHYDVYGYWSDAIHDYEDMGILDRLQSKEFKRMMKIVDPYSYFNRLIMPKFIVNSTGDQFFLPDSSQFYFNDLKKEKYLRYVPNTDHGLNQEAIDDFTAFYHSVLNDHQRPKFTWKKHPDGHIKLKTETPPSAVRLWQATNPKDRIFRLDTIGEAWSSTALAPDKEGVYIGEIEAPQSGWTAFMIELEYSTDGPFPIRVTTEVSVIPAENSSK